MVKMLILLILLLNALVIIWPLLPTRRKPRWIDFLPAIALGLCVLEFLLDEFSFRMIPVYVLTALVFLLTLRRLWRLSAEQPKRRKLAIVVSLVGLFSLVQSASLPLWILPFNPSPEPTGPYKVGTVTYAWGDTSRQEIYTDDPNDHRELPVQVWYPVDLADAIGGDNVNAPVSAAQPSYPLIVFSPGAFGPRESNYSTYQELASHGYIVAGIDHTYQAAYASFPDGRVIMIGAKFLEENQIHNRVIFTDPVLDDQIIQDWLKMRLADLDFVVDQLAQVNRDDPQGLLTGRMDLERIGFAGHSLGGMAVSQFCRQDLRCKAAINLDGPMYGDRISVNSSWEQTLVEPPFPKPLMIMYGMLYNDPQAYETIYLPNRKAVEQATEPVYSLVFDTAGHMNFTDLPLISPALSASLQGSGSIDAERCIGIVNTYTLAFFDGHLKGQAAPLLDGPSPDYPEVTFTAHNN
jgi:dienelactone hydrolase